MPYLKWIIIACGIAAFFTAAHADTANCDAECFHALFTMPSPSQDTFASRFVFAQAAPATQNTVTTTGPVTSDTTISVGTLAGQVLEWVVAVFGAAIGTVATGWVYRLFKIAGVSLTDSMRARLQQIVLNGMHLGAEQAQKALAGKGQVDIHNAAVAGTIAYVKSHGADELKQLGIDPNSNALTDVVKARIAALAADPTVATPPVLNAPASLPAAPVAPVR